MISSVYIFALLLGSSSAFAPSRMLPTSFASTTFRSVATTGVPDDTTTGPENPVIEKGWRIDGWEDCGRTPNAAEAQLGLKVARADKYFDKNVFTPYYGKKLQLKTFDVLERTPFNTLMQAMVALNKPHFIFGFGYYFEHILWLNPPYAIPGYVDGKSLIVWGPQADPGGYGSLTVDSIEGDIMTIMYRSKARGLLRMTLELPAPPTA